MGTSTSQERGAARKKNRLDAQILHKGKTFPGRRRSESVWRACTTTRISRQSGEGAVKCYRHKRFFWQRKKDLTQARLSAPPLKPIEDEPLLDRRVLEGEVDGRNGSNRVIIGGGEGPCRKKGTFILGDAEYPQSGLGTGTPAEGQRTSG